MKALLLGSRRDHLDHHVLGNAEAWLELCRGCTVSMHIEGLYKLARHAEEELQKAGMRPRMRRLWVSFLCPYKA